MSSINTQFANIAELNVYITNKFIDIYDRTRFYFNEFELSNEEHIFNRFLLNELEPHEASPILSDFINDEQAYPTVIGFNFDNDEFSRISNDVKNIMIVDINNHFQVNTLLSSLTPTQLVNRYTYVVITRIQNIIGVISRYYVDTDDEDDDDTDDDDTDDDDTDEDDADTDDDDEDDANEVLNVE